MASNPSPEPPMPAVAAKPTAVRSMRILGNPIVGLVRVLVTAGRESAEYVFARRTADVIGVRKAGAESGYTVDAGRCSCPAGVHGKPCKHTAAAAKLAALGHL